MFTKLFPYKLHLQILQLDEYDSKKFLQWVLSHYWTRNIENKKSLIWTQKAKAIYLFAITIAFITLLIGTFEYKIIGLVIGLFFATQSYVFLVLSSLFLLPLETYKKNKIKQQTENKLRSLKNLKIIGITGSYGKTSVKEFLYQILKTHYPTLKTPGSFNTPYGIAKVVDLEMDDSYEYFVCEMGAYKVGDIKEICDMVHPRYGILTGINEQHLETFGSLENTTKGKFELIEVLPADGFGIVNIDNEHVRKKLQEYIDHYSSSDQSPVPYGTGQRESRSILFSTSLRSARIIATKHGASLVTYGFSDEKFSIRKIKQTQHGSEFLLILDGKVHDAKTKLLGMPNIQNILAAATMSFLLGMQPKAIVSAITNLKPVPHRLEIKESENMTIIDDAYNSNVDGFKEAVKLLKTFTKQTKVFVTPGIVDLGDETAAIHEELGGLLTGIDYVFLIGKSERTYSLKGGIEDKTKIIELSSIKNVWQKIEELKLNHPVVLLENDLPDNY